MKKILFAFSLLIASGIAQANTDASIFIKREYHDEDFVSGFGVEARLINPQTNIGLALTTSIGAAQATDYEGYVQEYIAWEGGFKLGYFSDIFFYAEAGVDLGELTFNDRDEDSYYHDHYDDNKIDGYVGAGIGINLGRFRIEGYSRIRQLDGEHWEAPNQTYTGLQLSLNF